MSEQSERELAQAIRELRAATERNTGAINNLTGRLEGVEKKIDQQGILLRGIARAILPKEAMAEEESDRGPLRMSF